MTTTTPQDRNGNLEATLERHAITPTPQRLQIAAVMLSEPQHLSADQVLARVNAQGAGVSKATVYNTLGLFAAKGLIREVFINPAKVFYDSNTAPHYHFFNVDTGKLTDFERHDLPLSSMPPPPEGTLAEGVDVIVRLRNKP